MDSPALVKRKLYGREDYYAVYSAARGIIIRHKLLRIKQFELTCDGTRRLTICNLWRMERTTDNTLHLAGLMPADEEEGASADADCGVDE